MNRKKKAGPWTNASPAKRAAMLAKTRATKAARALVPTDAKSPYVPPDPGHVIMERMPAPEFLRGLTDAQIETAARLILAIARTA